MAEKQDEIDLLELVSKVVILFKKNLWLIILCIAICFGASLAIYYSKDRVYSSRMIVYSDILTKSYSEKLALNLKDLIEDDSYTELSSKLGLTPGEAEELVDLRIESALDDASPQVEEARRLFLVITVEVKDNAILPKLQTGIMKFIGENSFVKVRVEQRKKYYEELIQKVSMEIEKLEEVKKKISEGTFKSGGGMLLMDPSEPFSKSIDLFKERLSYQQSLELVNSVQLVEGFVPFDRPIKPRLSLTIGEGILAGFLLASMIMFFRYISKVTAERTS